MNLVRWPSFQKLRALLRETAPSAADLLFRLQTVERDIILPVKAVAVGFLFYSLYRSRWFDNPGLTQSVALQTTERFFLFYLALNAVVAFLLIFGQRLPSVFIQRVIFTSSFVDGLFLAALTFVTGGFESILYWMYLGLIVRNALSIPLAFPQILLNFSLSLCYLAAGILDLAIPDDLAEFSDVGHGTWRHPTEPFLLRLIVLWLMTLCCYGVQVLFEKQRQAEEEGREFTTRQKQLSSAGRLAAKIAHQIKNPLGIINNAAYALQRALDEGKAVSRQQLQIIREEVERADNIITKLMGYAQLAEGQVEKLTVAEELDRAIARVFPPGAKYEVTVSRDYAAPVPALLMQREHLAEIFTNLLLNSREAMNGQGQLTITAAPGPDNAVVVTIADSGPGIRPDRLEKIFEPYYSTKEKGTGLGLSIVKHNTELYGGSVKVESDVGKGSRFILHFPTRTFMKLQP